VNADTIWARVIPSRRGDLTAVGEALQGADGFKITVRFRTDIAIDDRISWRGKVMRVLSANDENGWRQFTTIYTDAGTVTA
jgi:SPP1 family predicted phage head-tail adaptor